MQLYGGRCSQGCSHCYGDTKLACKRHENDEAHITADCEDCPPGQYMDKSSHRITECKLCSPGQHTKSEVGSKGVSNVEELMLAWKAQAHALNAIMVELAYLPYYLHNASR